MNKGEFISEAEGQLKNLNEWLQEIEDAIDEETNRLTRLRQLRQQAVDDIATRLLPDLSRGSVERVNQTFPDLITVSWVTAEINKRRKQNEQRLQEITSLYTPETFESRLADLDVTIDKLSMDFNEIEKGYQAFLSTQGIGPLLKSGYGTSQYSHTWMERQYYRDWKRADEILVELRCGNWTEIQTKWDIISGGYETAKQQLINTQEEKEELKRLHFEHETLTQSQNNLEADVLNTCHTMIKSQLDLNVDKSSPLLKQVVEIDQRMQESSNKINNELQDRRSKVHDQMLSLQQIIASASQSRQQEVPDEYASTIRGVGGGYYGGMAQPQINIISQPAWYYDDWIIPYNHRSTIINYFGSTSRSSNYNNYYDHQRDVSEGRYGYVS
jgi:hypothetical protein